MTCHSFKVMLELPKISFFYDQFNEIEISIVFVQIWKQEYAKISRKYLEIKLPNALILDDEHSASRKCLSKHLLIHPKQFFNFKKTFFFYDQSNEIKVNKIFKIKYKQKCEKFKNNFSC